MSKNINVNPGFYNSGGREHAEGHGEAITHELDKQQLTTSQPPNESPKAEQISRARRHAAKKK